MSLLDYLISFLLCSYFMVNEANKKTRIEERTTTSEQTSCLYNSILSRNERWNWVYCLMTSIFSDVFQGRRLLFLLFQHCDVVADQKSSHSLSFYTTFSLSMYSDIWLKDKCISKKRNFFNSTLAKLKLLSTYWQQKRRLSLRLFYEMKSVFLILINGGPFYLRRYAFLTKVQC